MNTIETIESHVRHLTNGQNADGGWGHELRMPSSTTNTAEVVTAMLDSGVPPPDPGVLERALALILAGQAEDGGWSSRDAKRNESSQTLATAWAIHSLVRRPTTAALVALGKAKPRLLGLQAASGAWIEYADGAESVTATCHALLALVTLSARQPNLGQDAAAAMRRGIGWLGSAQSEGMLAFVKGGKPDMAVTVLGAYTSQRLARASFGVGGLMDIEEHVLTCARAFEPALFQHSVETEDLHTFRFQYQHCTQCVLVRFLLSKNEPVQILWPFLRHFWKLQEPGGGSSADVGGRRTTWATAQWILAASDVAAAARERPDLSRELSRIALPERALIMKGGGVKGLALAGAIVELEEKGVRFDIIAGTSAGAIAAVLLAAGYSGVELETKLRQLDFKTFLDGPLRKVRNVVFRRALHSGEPIRTWVKQMVSVKITRADAVRMRHLGRRAIIFATNVDGTITFDSHGENRDTSADFAVRCSMSIPAYFIAHEHEGKPVYDGGLLHNFPVTKLLETIAAVDFVGLYLEPPPPTKWWFKIFNIVDILLSQDESQLVAKHASKMVRIDPNPVRTTQFSLTESEKDLLVWRGRAAARVFLKSEGLVTDAEVQDARDKAQAYLALVTKQSATRRRWRRVAFGAVVIAGVLAFSPYGALAARFLRQLIGR